MNLLRKLFRKLFKKKEEVKKISAKKTKKITARALYISYYGTIPSGYVVYHKDGNKNHNHIRNLEAISRSELLKKNLKKKK